MLNSLVVSSDLECVDVSHGVHDGGWWAHQVLLLNAAIQGVLVPEDEVDLWKWWQGHVDMSQQIMMYSVFPCFHSSGSVCEVVVAAVNRAMPYWGSFGKELPDSDNIKFHCMQLCSVTCTMMMVPDCQHD